MGFLDNLKDKAEEFGEKAKEGFEAAKDKAADLVDDVKERFDQDETPEQNVDAGADNSPEPAEASAAPTADPLETADQSGDATPSTAGLGAVADEPVIAPDDPLDGTPDGTPVVTPDDGSGQLVDGQAGTPNAADDPVDGTTDAGLGTLPEEPVESGYVTNDPVDGTSDRDAL
jgi:hypothetical protein